MTEHPLMRWFDSAHLPDDLRRISGQVELLAESMDEDLPDSEEKTAGMRKLLEAKDCFVRAEVAMRG